MAKLPRDSKFLKKARDRYRLADEADAKQAIREREDISFEDGDQWPADIQLARQGQQPVSGMPAVPARPTLVINKLREPVENVLNQARQADLGVQIVAAEDFGDLGIVPDETEIELREGLVRRIQRNSDAADARLWAFKRALIAGRGYYLVNTRYLPGKTFDQEVYVSRIYNQEAVKCEPSRQKPYGSEADWWFVGTWMLLDRFVAEYPEDVDGKKNPFAASKGSTDDFISLTESYPDWFRVQGEERSIRIVDHWYTERESERLAILEDGSVVAESDVPKDVKVVQTRMDVVPKVKFCKIGGGCMEIQRTDWAGPDMPVIQVLGNEVLPYDEQKRYEGMIRQSRSAQMGENVMISKFVESVGLSPIPRDRIDPEAIDGYEQWWQVANTRTLPYLPYRTRNDQGQETRPPLPGNADPNILPMAQGISLFDQFIRSTSAVPDPSLGNVDPSLKSDRAIKTVIANAAKSTGHYLDNFGRSVTYEGQVENNLLYPIYGARPGRLVRLLTGDNESQMVGIGDPSQIAPTQPPQPGMPPQPNPQQMQAQKVQKVAKLTKDASFNVIIKLASNADNRRQQFVQMFSQLLAADPHQMLVAGDLFYKNMDIPEARELAARQKAMLAPPVQAYIQAKEQGAVDPQAAVQVQSLKQQVQHAEAAMGELKQQADGKMLSAQAQIHAEELKQQGESQRKQMEMDRDLELQRMKDATSIRVAQIQAETKGIIEANAAQDEALALGMDQAHDAAQSELDRQHERDLAAQSMAHEAATGAADQGAAMQSQVMQSQSDAAQPQTEGV